MKREHLSKWDVNEIKDTLFEFQYIVDKYGLDIVMDHMNDDLFFDVSDYIFEKHGKEIVNDWFDDDDDVESVKNASS